MLKFPAKVMETLQIIGAPRTTQSGGVYFGDRPLTTEEITAAFGISVKAAERMQRVMGISR